MSSVVRGVRDRLKRREIPALPGGDAEPRRSLSAAALSFLLHLVGLFLLAAFWVNAPSGTGGSADRPVGIAVVYDAGNETTYELQDGSESESESSPSANDLASSLPSANGESTAAAELLSGILPANAGAGADAAAAAGGLGLGGGGSDIGGSRKLGKVKAQVFGVEGEGSRFVYVFDRSDSMNEFEGRPLAAAKRELRRSLESLSEAHQFQVIFYNDAPLPIAGMSSGGAKLFRADDQHKRLALEFIRDIGATGGTRHRGALQMALGMGPDVVFFLTDADTGLRPTDIEEMHIRAARGGCTIHSIQFGKGAQNGPGNWIRQLAEGSGGQYRYIDITLLDAP